MCPTSVRVAPRVRPRVRACVRVISRRDRLKRMFWRAEEGGRPPRFVLAARRPLCHVTLAALWAT